MSRVNHHVPLYLFWLNIIICFKFLRSYLFLFTLIQVVLVSPFPFYPTAWFIWSLRLKHHCSLGESWQSVLKYWTMPNVHFGARTPKSVTLVLELYQNEHSSSSISFYWWHGNLSNSLVYYYLGCAGGLKLSYQVRWKMMAWRVNGCINILGDILIFCSKLMMF